MLLVTTYAHNYASTIDKGLKWTESIKNSTSRLACVAGACKWWAQEKTGAREGDTRDTPCVSPSRAPVLSFARYFQAPATQATSRQKLSF